MIADDQPPQDELALLAAKFAQEVQKRKPDFMRGYECLVLMPEEIYDRLTEYCRSEKASFDDAVVEAIANYLPNRDVEAEIDEILEESTKPEPPAPNYFQDWARICDAAYHQVWQIKEMAKRWRDTRFADAFWRSEEATKNVEESDRNG